MDASFWIFAIVLPLAFIVGVVYNAIKDQKKLEKTELKKILEQRQSSGYKPRSYDDEEDDWGQKSVFSPAESLGGRGTNFSSLVRGEETLNSAIEATNSNKHQATASAASSPSSPSTAPDSSQVKTMQELQPKYGTDAYGRSMSKANEAEATHASDYFAKYR